MTASTPDIVQASLAALGQTLALATALRDAERAIDLTGLEQEVAAACVAALALPQQDQPALRGALEDVRHRLERLVAACDADPFSPAAGAC